MIEAQEQLKLLSAYTFKNLKKKDQESTKKTLYNQAYPNELKAKNYVSIEDVQKVLGR